MHACRHVLLPKDYIRYRLTGEYAMDKADGSGTVLFDLAKRDWSDELLATLEIPRCVDAAHLRRLRIHRAGDSRGSG